MDSKSNKIITCTQPIKGMMCKVCVAHVDKALHSINGVSDVTVNLEAANATFTYDSSLCSLEQIKQVICDAGYEMSIEEQSANNDSLTSCTVPVKGMKCKMCVAHVDKALHSIDGVSDILVNLEEANASFRYDSLKCTLTDIKQVVDAEGFEMIIESSDSSVNKCCEDKNESCCNNNSCEDKSQDSIVTTTVPVKGMRCSACVMHVNKALNDIDGIKDVSVNLKAANITVTYDSAKCSLADMKNAIDEAGYEMILEEEHSCNDTCCTSKKEDDIVNCTLPVTGMRCAVCAVHVDKAIKGVEGVTEASVNLIAANAMISYDKSKCTLEQIQKAVRNAGYDLLIEEEPKTAEHIDATGKKEITCTLPVVGMGCAACAIKVDKTLHNVTGVKEASVNFAACTAQITFDSDNCSTEKLQQAVREAGYDLLIEDRESANEKAEKIRIDHYNHMRRSCIGAWVLSIPIAIASMAFADNISVQYGVWIAATISVFAFGRDFFTSAWNQFKHFSFNMDTLVATSTGIAYLFSVFNLLFPEFWEAHGIKPHLYFETSSGLIAFILLGRTLEERAKRRTSASIEHLIGLRPKRVTVITDNGEQKIPISRVQKGDIILVHNGERVAVDGTVTEGSTYIDESMLSGEPVPVFKNEGTQVFSGTMNTDAAFKFRADKVGDDTVLAQIIKMVEEAQGSRAPIQNAVDKIAGIFVPTIISIAILTFCIWYFFAPTEGFSHGLLTMMTVLVIACPCALGLATPTAIMVGIGRGADAGILIKDAESLQTARKIDTVVLDKTGTLTEGHPEVVGTLWDDDNNKREDILSALEHQSEHPLAQAVVSVLKDVNIVELTDIQNIPGVGVSASYNGVSYSVGNEKHLKEEGISISNKLRVQADKWLDESNTLVWFADDKKALAVVALNDTLKETSTQAVNHLHDMGIEVCLLTGDNQRSAEVVAKKVGIDKVKAGVLPQDKAKYIEELKAEGKCVAMVGDGINDSAALATADLSIAMGHGSDVAIDASGVTILSSDLMKISEMIRLSHATMRILHENLFWALIYNSICIPIAAGVLYPFFGILLHPMIGGAAMAFSSVSVVTNSLRLARVKLIK